MKLIQDEIFTMAERIRVKLSLDAIKPYYSTPYEFVTMLSKLRSNVKYPFIFINSIGVRYSDDGIVTVPDVVFATLSDKNWSARERDEKSMKPILIPLVDEFERQLGFSRELRIQTVGDKTLHYFYGTTGINGYDGAIFPDHVDAIQLTNYRFRISKNCKK